MDKLRDERKKIKTKLTKFKTFVDSFTTPEDVSELKLRLEKIEELWDKFDTVQTSIECIDANEEKYRTPNFEDIFYKVVAQARKIIYDSQQQEILNVSAPVESIAQSSSNAIRVKLPAINLPTFAGNYADWLMFSDSFISIIDKNDGLNNIQKFQYLRGSLKNDALQVIQSLETTEDNYPIAWNLLKNRFENKQLIINTHLKNLFELTAIGKESHTNLRQFIDTIRTNLSALRTLKEKVDDWDTMLVYLFNSKLDWRTRQLWQEKLVTNTDQLIPTLQMFLDFLASRSQSLEMAERTTRAEVSSKFIPLKKNTTFTTTRGPKCEHCNEQHYIFRCDKFIKLPSYQRFEEARKMKLCTNCLKAGHFKQDCRSQTSCRKCNKRHNTLLHRTQTDYEADGKNSQDTKPSKQTGEKQVESKQQQNVLVSNAVIERENHVFLPTATVMVFDTHGNAHQARALLDSGSQSNFITRELKEKLNLSCSRLNMEIYGINNKMTNIKEQVAIKIKSRFNGFTTNMNCLILEKITDSIPQICISKQSFNLPENINLADDHFNTTAPIDLLIGSEIFWRILSTGQIFIAKDKPILQKTLFGWIVSGAYSINHTAAQVSCLAINDSIENQMEKFWKIEEITSNRNWTEEEERCEDHFKRTYQRNEDGRFVVKLPRRNLGELGDTYESALTRFKYLERKLQGNPELKHNYIEFMRQYQHLNHMTKLQPEIERIKKEVFYLPHHPVIKEDSLTTKTRVVFDGSHKSNLGRSLNDELIVGPMVQEDLFHIILRFRSHHYVLSADITMMYRQILIHEDDRNLQRIIWREEPTQEIQIYTLNTVTYGTSSAPYLATKCLQQLAQDDGNQFPLAKSALLEDFYVDDLLTGTDTKEKAIDLQNQLNQLLHKGGFHLRKWRANDVDVLKHLTKISEPQELLVIIKNEPMKTLGLYWNTKTDSIHYKVMKTNNERVTKRNILSQIVQIFDPLGLIGPVVIKAKCIMQTLWRLQLQWDETIPQELHTEWIDYRNSLNVVDQLQLPRDVNINNHDKFIDIHGFCDASEMAYGACIYATSFNKEGVRNTNLLCAKARVAPLKTISLPKLELCGATLLARLISEVEQALRFKIRDIYLWTDSTIVLSWINMDTRLLKTFVANRIAEVQRLTSCWKWNHVRSAENPADIISRGQSAHKLLSNTLWWNGPEWLKDNKWPQQPDSYEKSTIEIKSVVTLSTQNRKMTILTKYSKLLKLQRVLSYCMRFIYNLKHQEAKRNGELTTDELTAALEKIIYLVQNEVYSQEIQDLTKNKAINNKSKLLNLNPFVDEKGLLRVGGRIHNAEVTTDQKHPWILPDKHHVTNLIFKHEHRRTHHCGPEQLLSIMRTRFWPIAGRAGAKRVIRNCLDCFRVQPKKTNHVMGNLPASRVCNVSRPFTITGIDYAGPIQIREHKRRGRVLLTKGYIAIFVCFTTKAIHIELVSDLTTDTFIAALRRFVARRGMCKEIYSDNATNFQGANRQLREIYDFLNHNTNKIEQEMANRQIKWNFIPARAPHMGGLWEAAVKSTKRHFYKVAKTFIFTYEEVYTLLTEIEAILNSRPLIPLSSSPNDFTPLTPAHFLVGDTLLSPVEHNFTNTPDNKLSRWQHIQRLKQHFWKRWQREYLHQLQQRTKWKTSSPNIEVGTLVVLIEDNTPPLRWPMGRIIKVHPGPDNVVRVVTVRTSHGTYKRPVKKVCVVPSEGDE